MKKILVLLLALQVNYSPTKAQGPISLIIKEAVKKVIVAIDLKIQRLQTKTIWLQNAQKTLENTMSKLKLDEISGWVEKQKRLYQDYFDELWKVKDVVAYYHKVKEISEKQVALVKSYKKTFQAIEADKHFSAEEILYMGQVYTGIIEESLKNLELVSLVISSFTSHMSDAKRIELMDQAAEGISKNYDDLRIFNSQNLQLSLARAQDAQEIQDVRRLYGIAE
ncbi:MAG: conjugal transfer protein TraI [Flavisolibacter sp.]